jgi:hypothetical protein
VTGAGEEGSRAVPGQRGRASAANESVELDLYKLAVEMADRISGRRALANTFFLTVNTGLAALLGGNNLRWYVAAAGIVFALAWWWLLQSYRKLNWAKFEVINAIEPRLPLQLFSDEFCSPGRRPAAGENGCRAGGVARRTGRCCLPNAAFSLVPVSPR